MNLISQFLNDFQTLNSNSENSSNDFAIREGIAKLYDKYSDKLHILTQSVSSKRMQELVEEVTTGFALIDQQKVDLSHEAHTPFTTEKLIANMDKPILEKLKEIFKEIAKFFQEAPSTFIKMVASRGSDSNDLQNSK